MTTSDWIEDLEVTARDAFSYVANATELNDALEDNCAANSERVGGVLEDERPEAKELKGMTEALHESGLVNLSPEVLRGQTPGLGK